MKKKNSKNILLWCISCAVFLLTSICIMINLEKLNILTYLLFVAFLPVLILGTTSFFYGFLSDINKSRKYGVVITMAVIYSVIGMMLNLHFVDFAVMNQIIENTKVSSESVSMSVQSGTTGDMIQSYFLNVAFSCIGCIFGNFIKTNKAKKAENYQQVVQAENEYDH